MAQTWTDTTYKLDGSEMTIVTTHEGFNQVSLYIPGYSLDGRGFSIYFGIDHIELLEDLVDKLKEMATATNGQVVRLQESSPLRPRAAKVPELVN
ncbi:MAG: hypothetical protein F6K32_10120 [Desertifilum sp. SIO1I2]|nr:hypothetical protein [Desertifilum sp. SIO1I2]